VELLPFVLPNNFTLLLLAAVVAVARKPQIIGGGSKDRSPDVCKLPAGLTMEKLMIASTIVDVAAIIAFGAAVSLMAMMFLLY
jgi:hypothetical protein